MTRFWNQRRLAICGQRGFTLIELMIVVAIIGILAAIAVPLFASVQQRARLSKAQADTRALVSAITIYIAHMGVLPPNLSALTSQTTNNEGQAAGPFMNSVPAPPAAWAAYGYASSTNGVFQVSTSHATEGSASAP